MIIIIHRALKVYYELCYQSNSELIGGERNPQPHLWLFPFYVPPLLMSICGCQVFLSAHQPPLSLFL